MVRTARHRAAKRAPERPLERRDPMEIIPGLRAGLAVFARRRDDIVRIAFGRAQALEHAGTAIRELHELARWASSHGVPCPLRCATRTSTISGRVEPPRGTLPRRSSAAMAFDQRPGGRAYPRERRGAGARPGAKPVQCRRNDSHGRVLRSRRLAARSSASHPACLRPQYAWPRRGGALEARAHHRSGRHAVASSGPRRPRHRSRCPGEHNRRSRIRKAEPAARRWETSAKGSVTEFETGLANGFVAILRKRRHRVAATSPSRPAF